MSKHTDVSEIVEDLKEKMRKAIMMDNSCNRKQQPAIYKLKLLPEVIEKVGYKDYKNEMLKSEICNELKGFLEPLPDGSFPNLKIKIEILELLDRLDIKKEHLLNSGIGKIVYFYSHGKKECKRVRQLSKDLVNKWTRILSE